MKVFVFLVALTFFVGSFFLFGYAFEVATVSETGAAWVFLAGIAAVCISLAIPFHLLEKFD